MTTRQTVPNPDDDREASVDPRRGFLGLALAGVTGGSLAIASSAIGADPATARKGLAPPGAPAAAKGYSPGVLVEGGKRVVFVSGQGPADVKADMETQVRQTFDRIELVLEAAGATLADVVMLRAYFVHVKRDLPIYRKVRMDYLKEPFPASTAIGVAELAEPGLEIEIEAIAVV